MKFFTINIEDCVSYLGFSYADYGWHPFKALSSEILYNKRLKYYNSILYKFYNTFCPETLAQAHCLDDSMAPMTSTIPANIYAHFYPWANRVKLSSRTEMQHFGPCPSVGESHFSKIKKLSFSIRKHGYTPRRFNAEPISGYFLKHDNHDKFLVRTGLHRLGVLAAIGYTDVDVVIFNKEFSSPDPDCPVISTESTRDWPLVKNKFISYNEAVNIFSQYFTLTGFERKPPL